jgi:hypothetical protein
MILVSAEFALRVSFHGLTVALAVTLERDFNDEREIPMNNDSSA